MVNTNQLKTSNKVEKVSSKDGYIEKKSKKNKKSTFYTTECSKLSEFSQIKPPLCVVVAINDYDRGVAGHLSFSKGDRLNVTDKSDVNWWYGYNGYSEEGLIPAVYVREIFSKQVVAFSELEKVLPVEKNLKKPTKQTKPSKHQKISVFYTEEPVPEESVEVVEALYDFNGGMEDEISFSKGDKLSIIDKRSKDWWQASNTRGEIGSIPSSYVKSLKEKLSSTADRTKF
uniref:Cytoplasmic protein NCK2 (Trinotate prediction) n=1 Tax=Myxobolus squamalis TaxID=59785 RepID=A0A6B2FY37_MYXSQ